MAKLSKREWRQKNHIAKNRMQRAMGPTRGVHPAFLIVDDPMEVVSDELMIEVGDDVEPHLATLLGDENIITDPIPVGVIVTEVDEVTADEAEVILTDLDQELGDPELDQVEEGLADSELLDQK